MRSMKRSGTVPGITGQLMAGGVLALALAGIAAAQTGTITFRGAIANPSCGFTPTAVQVQARCVDASGRTVSAPVPMPPARAGAHARVATAKMRVEPVFRSLLGGRRGRPDGYVMVVTYQ
ncbi:hypothetical protein JTE92_03400 [Cupriavidus oxalaticus]|uniref:Type 1 fimbrial protein n=2 Tax=Cupriavidus oxalaticus TaxID=96344 RepID=A0A976BH43_9BURK|nr:hypothetical protein JTE91_08945 [Cupriavidus oxalaticus]QRQ91985.1 hypothetical protein JTE92_03400 [Cupriavidus oxalaticus]SPC19433.1 conserved exported hypothetical protein [Cupriavidus oxalaticus]